MEPNVISSSVATEAFISGFALVFFIALLFVLFAFMVVWVARQLKGAANS